MWEYVLIFVSSTLASSHCIGMCGGFALIIGLHSGSCRQNLVKQLCYSAGRVLTYSALGLAAGLVGAILVQKYSGVMAWQAALAIVAGILLVYQSLQAFGFKIDWNWFKNRSDNNISTGTTKRSLACHALRNFRTLLTAPDWVNVFLAGVLTGFLPCGLVYSFLALAASRTHAYQSWLTMIVFGLGTIPLMVLAGVGSAALSVDSRRRIWRLAAICVLITGILSITRGVNAWHIAQGHNASIDTVCPCCNK